MLTPSAGAFCLPAVAGRRSTRGFSDRPQVLTIIDCPNLTRCSRTSKSGWYKFGQNGRTSLEGRRKRTKHVEKIGNQLFPGVLVVGAGD